MIYAPTVRQWSEHVFAAGWVGRNMSPSGGSAHHAQTAGRYDPDPDETRKRGARV